MQEIQGRRDIAQARAPERADPVVVGFSLLCGRVHERQGGILFDPGEFGPGITGAQAPVDDIAGGGGLFPPLDRDALGGISKLVELGSS